jgi:hypothetical protein
VIVADATPALATTKVDGPGILEVTMFVALATAVAEAFAPVTDSNTVK